MTINSKAEQLINLIKPPISLTDRQVANAKRYVQAKMHDGHTIGNFCSENKISTKTWYTWMEEDAFKSYLNQIADAVVPTNEKDAYAKIKLKILQIAEKTNPSIKEIELFTDTFSYVVEADKRERMVAMGMTDAPTEAKTIDERKEQLLKRLHAKD